MPALFEHDIRLRVEARAEVADHLDARRDDPREQHILRVLFPVVLAEQMDVISHEPALQVVVGLAGAVGAAVGADELATVHAARMRDADLPVLDRERKLVLAVDVAELEALDRRVVGREPDPAVACRHKLEAALLLPGPHLADERV